MSTSAVHDLRSSSAATALAWGNVDHANLLEQAKRGDPASFNELIERFAPLVRSVARRTGIGAIDVDDVTQEVWLKLLRNIGAIETPACLPGWLRRVTFNTAVDIGLRGARMVPCGQMPDVMDPSNGSRSDDLGDADTSTALRLALASLATTDRTLLALLMENARPDYARISGLVGRPVGSLGPTRQRLLNRLRRHPALVRAMLDA